MASILRWWFIFCSSILGVVLAYFLGFFTYLNEVDQSHIGKAVLAIYLLGTLFVGQLTFRARHRRGILDRHGELCWYLPELMMGLGMVGTLVGFLLLLSTALGSPINTADTQAMMKLIANMGSGFSTAVITTLIGLVCSLAFKLQLINLRYLDES